MTDVSETLTWLDATIALLKSEHGAALLTQVAKQIEADGFPEGHNWRALADGEQIGGRDFLLFGWLDRPSDSMHRSKIWVKGEPEAREYTQGAVDTLLRIARRDAAQEFAKKLDERGLKSSAISQTLREFVVTE